MPSSVAMVQLSSGSIALRYVLPVFMDDVTVAHNEQVQVKQVVHSNLQGNSFPVVTDSYTGPQSYIYT